MPMSTHPAGRRRFWLTVLCFALANAGMWIGYIVAERHRHAPPAISSFSEGEGAEVGARPSLHWTFDRDMTVATGNPDAAMGSVQPNIAGRWHWQSPRLLCFSPETDLPIATRFTFTLTGERLASADGARLPKPYVCSVHTAPLQLLAARQAEFDEHDRLVIELTFNEAVLPSEVEQHLKLENDTGKAVPFHLHGLATGKTVRVMTDAPVALSDKNEGKLHIKLTPGLLGQGGPLAMAEALERTLAFSTQLMATDLSAYAPSNSDAVLNLSFNNNVAPDLLKQVLSVEPAIPFVITSSWRGNELRGAFESGKRYVVKIAAPPGHSATSSYPRPATLGVMVPDRAPRVWFEHEEGYLGAAGNRLVLAHAVNVQSVKVSVTRVYDSNLVAWRTSRRRYNGWLVSDEMSRPIATREIHLKVDKNHAQDVRLSLDELLPESAPRDGVYRIALTANLPSAADEENDAEEEAPNYQRGETAAVVSLSDIGLSAKQGRTGVTIWATSLATAKPLANVHARIYSNKNQLLGEATTDATGLAQVAIAGLPTGEKPAVIIAQRLPAPTQSPEAPADEIQASAKLESEPQSPKIPSTASTTSPAAAPVRSARDLTWLDLNSSAVTFDGADTGGRAYLHGGYEAFVYTDRGVYRPGEIVHLRAIVRGADNAQPPTIPVRWQLRRPDLHDWKSQTAELDADGATEITIALPTDLPTGRWSAHVGLAGGEGASRFFGDVSFQVEEFVPQRMKVAVSLGASDGAAGEKRLQLSDQPLQARVQADYLFGRPVTERPATLMVRIDPISFRPAKWEDWTFGDSAATAEALGEPAPIGRRIDLTPVALNDNGRATFDIDVEHLIEPGEADGSQPFCVEDTQGALEPAARSGHVVKSARKYTGPWQISVATSVTETGGRAVNATVQTQVDGADAYIGIRPPRATPLPGSSSDFEIATVSPAGSAAAPAARDVEVSLFKELWNESVVNNHGFYNYVSTRLLKTVEAQPPHRLTLQAGHGVCSITPPEAGRYVLRVLDVKTNCVSSLAFYAGAGGWEDSVSLEKPQKLGLVVNPGRPDAPLDPGAAEVIVRSPFPGQLLLCIETDDVISTRVMQMPQSHAQLTINIPEAARPNAFLTATVVRAVDPNASWRTHRAIGVQRLSLSAASRRLNVAVAARKEVRPASSLDVSMLVSDSTGRPVPNAAVTVAAVDEGICQLTDFATPDPLAYFMSKRALGVHTADLFNQLMPEVAKPDGQSAVGGDKSAKADGSAHRLSPVTAPRFKPVSLWSGVLHTDPEGVARTGFAVPQFTGQLRLMAVASADKSFGSSADAVLVRSPVLVQSSWPRFAAPGDRFVVPLTMFNNSTETGEAKVSVELTDDDARSPLEFPNHHDRRIDLPPLRIAPGGQGITSFAISARHRIGAAHARITAHLADETFEEDVDLPVRPASPEITLGGYATATPAAPCKLELPGGMMEGTTQTQVRVSAAPLLELPKGLQYLDRYPYGCAEQTISTLFPLVYLPDIGARIAPDLFDRERVNDKVQVGITRLIGMQTSHGGLAMWPGGTSDWPWASVYAAHFLIEAKAAGYDVPPEFAHQLLAYVHTLLNKPAFVGDPLQTQAYACYVLALAGQPDRAAMGRIGDVLSATGIDDQDPGGTARFDLAAGWVAAGRIDLAQNLIPAAIPAPRQERALGSGLGSPVRDRAILISTLLAVSPEHPSLESMVAQLASEGRNGHWRSTQDTAFAVMALGRYLKQNRPSSPYESVALRSGDAVAARAGKGENITWNAPAKQDTGAESTTMHVNVSGAADAKAFVTWTQCGVPLRTSENADHGLKVRRTYFDSHQKMLPNNQLHSGDVAIVELTLETPTPLENVVVEDLLPAGVEVENPRLAASATIEEQPDSDVKRRELVQLRLDVRDDRIILVSDLAPGVSTYRYLVRATSSGTFVVPPVKAECMYDLGTSSIWSGGQTLTVAAPAGIAGPAVLAIHGK